MSVPSTETEAVKQFRNLVSYHARRYQKWGVEYEDLVQEGSIGVVKALRSWGGKPDSLPFWMSLHIKRQIRQAIGHEGTAGKGQGLRKPRKNASLDAEPEGRPGLYDLLGQDATQELATAERELHSALLLSMEKLNTKQKSVILLTLKGLNNTAIGAVIGRDRSRVRQLSQEAVGKLRFSLRGYRDAA